jgi:hypothetical protein
MAAGDHARQHPPDDVVLAAHDRAYSGFQAGGSGSVIHRLADLKRPALRRRGFLARYIARQISPVSFTDDADHTNSKVSIPLQDKMVAFNQRQAFALLTPRPLSLSTATKCQSLCCANYLASYLCPEVDRPAAMLNQILPHLLPIAHGAFLREVGLLSAMVVKAGGQSHLGQIE